MRASATSDVADSIPDKRGRYSPLKRECLSTSLLYYCVISSSRASGAACQAAGRLAIGLWRVRSRQRRLTKRRAGFHAAPHFPRKFITLFFSCSSQRFAKPIVELQHDATLGHVEGAMTFGAMPIEAYLPDLFWYGRHPVKLFRILETAR